MSSSLIIHQDQASWDAFARQHGGSFLQSWGWSVFQEAAGGEIFRFRIEAEADGDRPAGTIAQFLFIVRHLPFGTRYAYIPRGPVVAGGSDEEIRRDFEAFIAALREAAGRQDCAFSRIEPPWLRTGDALSSGDLKAYGFRQALPTGVDRSPPDTVIVDLDRGEDELLTAMHPKTRYNLRLAERHGVTVREAAYEGQKPVTADVEAFWRLLAETAERDKFHAHPRAYYEKMLDILSPRRGGGLQVRLVLAEHDGRPVAAALIADYGGTTTYLHGASSAADRRLMAPHLLHWRIMAEAKRRGCSRYDFWGVAPTDDARHSWAGVTRFKMGFGGRRESYLGAWELPNDALWYNLYRLAKKLRNV